MKKHIKESLSKDFRSICENAYKVGYMLTQNDCLAIGYMCGKYGLEKLLDNQDEVIDACRKYDETDDLALLDTIGETLLDLKIINNDKKIL